MCPVVKMSFSCPDHGLPARNDEPDRWAFSGGYDANALREAARNRRAWGRHPSRAARRDRVCFSKHIRKARNLVKRSFNRISQFRCISTAMTSLRRTSSPQ
jgi:transposase